jgi:hypothetical protein
MLENIKGEERFKVILSYAYRIVGRFALIAAFLPAIVGELHGRGCARRGSSRMCSSTCLVMMGT